MLHAAVLRSPYPSARIRPARDETAAAMAGVAIVLTAKDVPRNTLATDVPGQTTAVGPLRATLHVLAEDRVRHQGEPIALVAAETLELAQAAVEAIRDRVRSHAGVFTPRPRWHRARRRARHGQSARPVGGSRAATSPAR